MQLVKILIKSFFIVLLLNACSSSFHQPITFFQVQSPRPFGYVIGDEIKRRIIVEVRDGLALQYRSLPGKGEINRWLNLKKVAVNKIKTSRGTRYQIDLTYQLFYAPLEVKMLELPGFTLQFRQFGKMTDKQVPPWYFTAAPLRELAIRKQDGKEYMRPDTPAPFLDNTANQIRFAMFLCIAMLAAIYLAWVYGLLSFLPKYQVFKRPCRQLGKLSEREFASMLNMMHGALNQLNGKPLFQHRLTDFFQRFPDYQQLENEFRWFFECSNRYFFGSAKQVDKADVERIKIFCQHCLQVERGQR